VCARQAFHKPNSTAGIRDTFSLFTVTTIYHFGMSHLDLARVFYTSFLTFQSPLLIDSRILGLGDIGLSTVVQLQEKAAKYFQERPINFPEGRPYNCCESVLLALGEYLGVKSDLIPKIATGVGAGFSLNGFTCGSISGAAMAIGIKYGRKGSEESPQATWSRVNKFIEAFKERWGATTCRELTRLDVKTPEGMKEYLRIVHDYACTERVKFAIQKAIELLE
jgi:C_GCAxxG_C_C family probable redox protein